MDYCSICTSSHLLQQSAINRIKDPNESPFRARRSQELAVLREREACDPRIVRHDEFRPLRRVMLDPHLPLLEPWADQHERPCRLRHDAEPLGVGDRLNLVQTRTSDPPPSSPTRTLPLVLTADQRDLYAKTARRAPPCRTSDTD